jgi:hypothetical protein
VIAFEPDFNFGCVCLVDEFLEFGKSLSRDDQSVIESFEFSS